ncbi:MAG: copper chaperone PCu(A)C [Pseudonocardiaceae bacterium]
MSVLPRIKVLLTVVLVASWWPLAGCAAPSPQGKDWPANKNANALGSNADLGPIKLRNVYVARSADGSYQPGESTIAFMTLINDGAREDRLNDVTSKQARRVELRWDRACDGTAESVPDVPLLPNGTVPGPADKDVTGHLPYYLRITGFTERVRAGTTMPMTFHFERAGQITMSVKVQGRHRLDERGRYACGVLPVGTGETRGEG